MLEFLQDAGPLIYPLALCSLLAGTITLERVYALRRSRVLPKEIIEELLETKWWEHPIEALVPEMELFQTPLDGEEVR